MRKTHKFKTTEPYFSDVFSGRKTFDVRKNDRDFQVGDYIRLRKYDAQNDSYSGDEIVVGVIYILHLSDFIEGLEEDYVVLGIVVISKVEIGKSKPKIVCLCGSTRFYQQFAEQNYLETMAGNIVLSVGFDPHSSVEVHGEEIGITPEQKLSLDELHKRKIDLADEILVINVGGYIGESTRSEIEYAIANHKPVRYLEEVNFVSTPEYTEFLHSLANHLEENCPEYFQQLKDAIAKSDKEKT